MLFQISILQSAHVMSRQSAHVTSSLWWYQTITKL